MIDESRSGRPWSSGELDAIIADYFVMLYDDLAGRPYVKSRHSAALMAQLGRSHRSVEFKHQNISAVLDELGLPWIPGYIPKINYQKAIFEAIDRYLSQRPGILEFIPNSHPPSDSNDIFVNPPILSQTHEVPSRPLERLVRKYDPVVRDHRNRLLGKAGEAFVVEVERRRLIAQERADLARQIRWVAAEDGDGAGYDVLSYDPKGSELLIEVKTTNGSARTPFFLSRNECDLAAERPTDWRIFRVHLFARKPRIYTITPPLAAAVHLSPETWRASF